MHQGDFDEFSGMLDAVCSLLSRSAYTPSAVNTAMFFRALAKHSLAEVRSGFDAHVADTQRGRFVPVPADILAQIEGMAANDGRPGADEAWAIAIRSADERDTVVWTEETKAAWDIARSVFEAGDETGARMAFRDAYTRLVTEARARRAPAAWVTSLGFDAEMRAIAVKKAVEMGRLPLDQTEQLLLEGPAPGIEHLVTREIPPLAKKALLELRDSLASGPQLQSIDAIEKERTAELQAQTAQRVAEYQQQQPGEGV